MLPHNYAHWHSQQRLRLVGYTEDERWYTCLPLFHINAQFITVVSIWVAGGQVILGERFSATRFWDEIRSRNATGFNLIGTIPQMLLNQPPSPQDGQHNVRLALAGMDPERQKEFERRFNVHCIQSFGMTEGSPALMEPIDATTRPSMGRAIAGHEARIVDDNDLELGPNQVGELVFRPITPYSMMLGYYKQPEATLEAMRNFWFHTGDLAYKDENGFYFYVDRKKDSLRRRGENISSFEIESIVESHPAVAEAAAIGVPSELGDHEVKVVVVLNPGQTLTPRRAGRLLRAQDGDLRPPPFHGIRR